MSGGDDLVTQIAKWEVRNWQTPRANDAEKRGDFAIEERNGLPAQAKAWQTPSSGNFRTRGGDRADELGLDNQVKQWRTPTAADSEGHAATEGPRGYDNLHAQTQSWATPRAEDGQCADRRVERGVSDTLHAQTMNWGTPRADEHKGCGPKGCGPKGCPAQAHRLDKGYLDAQVEEVEAKGKVGEYLNPAWEEILMGWPENWTNPEAVCAGIWPGFPRGQGNEQFEYEPPRTVPTKSCPFRAKRVEMVGNGVVLMCAAEAFDRLFRESLIAEEGEE